jgi:hypothetical protein
MREVHGDVIEETEPDSGGDGAGRPVPVDVARNMLRATLEKQIQAAIRFHEKVVAKAAQAEGPISAPADNVLDFNTAKRQDDEIEPDHAAIRIPTGVGKSDAARKAIAGQMRKTARDGIGGYVREAKRKGLPHRVVYLVPTHKLGEEARQRMPEDITTALLQSRRATDVTTGEPLCLNLPAVEAAEAIGADVERAACRRKTRRDGEVLCPFYDQCSYQRQKAAAKAADIVFAAHQYLYAPPELLTKGTGLVVLDESFWQSGLSHSKLAVEGLGAELEAFPVRNGGEESAIDTEQLRSLIERLQQAVRALPTGEYVTKATLLTAGLRPGDRHEPGSGAGAQARMAPQGRSGSYDHARQQPGTGQGVRRAVSVLGPAPEARGDVESGRGIALGR